VAELPRHAARAEEDHFVGAVVVEIDEVATPATTMVSSCRPHSAQLRATVSIDEELPEPEVELSEVRPLLIGLLLPGCQG